MGILGSCMEPKVYNLLCNLCFPEDCESWKYADIVDILLKHCLSPAPNKFIEHIKFRECYQKIQKLKDFAAILKKLSFVVLLVIHWNKIYLNNFCMNWKKENIENKLITQVL